MKGFRPKETDATKLVHLGFQSFPKSQSHILDQISFPCDTDLGEVLAAIHCLSSTYRWKA